MQYDNPNGDVEKYVLMALALAREGEMRDKPTDIIGFGEVGHALAQRLDKLVGRKGICYYSHDQNDSEYHYLSFENMLEKSEFMFVTIPEGPESLALFEDLSKFNKNMKIIVISDGFESVTKRLVAKCEAGELGGVAFESDDPEILNKKYRGNVFAMPHGALK